MSQAGRTFLLSTYCLQIFVLDARRDRRTTKDNDSLCLFCAFTLVVGLYMSVYLHMFMFIFIYIISLASNDMVGEC